MKELMIKGYANGELVITAQHLGQVKYALEEEIKYNGAKSASIHIPELIYGDYEWKDGKWNCLDRR